MKNIVNVKADPGMSLPIYMVVNCNYDSHDSHSNSLMSTKKHHFY